MSDVLAFGLAGLGIIAGLALVREPVWAVELCKLFTLLLSLWAGVRFGVAGPAAITMLMAAGAVAVFPPGTVIHEAASDLLDRLAERLGYDLGG